MPTHRHVFTSESVTKDIPTRSRIRSPTRCLTRSSSRTECPRRLRNAGYDWHGRGGGGDHHLHLRPHPDIVRGTITSIGYTDANFGFDAQTCAC